MGAHSRTWRVIGHGFRDPAEESRWQVSLEREVAVAEARLLQGERRLFKCAANAVIFPSEHGLSQFAADQLLPLVGLPDQEAIGGSLHVTTLRLIFAAHRFNRLSGSISTPLPVIQEVRRWRAGLAVGVEVSTPVASQRYVTWSRTQLLSAIQKAQVAFGPAEEAQLSSLRDLLAGWDINRAAETLNKTARAAFEITDAVPTSFELISLLNFLGEDPWKRPAQP
jgi:hypothetical protein